MYANNLQDQNKDTWESMLPGPQWLSIHIYCFQTSDLSLPIISYITFIYLLNLYGQGQIIGLRPGIRLCC